MGVAGRDGSVPGCWGGFRCSRTPRRRPAYDGVNLDISELKRAEEALREADRRKDEFLATLAHELRNPLAPIRNGLQVLRLSGDRRRRWSSEARR